MATDIGDPRGQNKLADDSIEAIDRRARKRQEFLERVDAIQADTLSDLAQVDHELARRRLRGQLADYRFKMHLMPISNRSGFHISFPELPRLMNPQTVQDFENYIDRLHDFQRYAGEQEFLLLDGLEEGITQPAIILRDAVKIARAQIVLPDPRDSPLYKNIRPTGTKQVAGRGVETNRKINPRCAAIPCLSGLRSLGGVFGIGLST